MNQFLKTQSLGKINRTMEREGAVTVLVLFLVILMLTAAVFAVDYGYLLVVRTDLQRAADKAALAAVQDLVPDSFGNQNSTAARSTARAYAAINLGDENFSVADSDIEIGRYEPSTVYSNLTILPSGVRDTVRVTLRRDDLNNSSVSLFFARLLGFQTADVSARSTAILQKGQFLPPGSDILPIAIPQETWTSHTFGDEWSIYGNGQLIDAEGNEVPGNWGTLDIGRTSNANSDIVDQIMNGLRQRDLDALANAGTIPSNTHIDGDATMWLNGDTGFSAGMKDAIRQSHGSKKLIPIFSDLSNGNGGNLDYEISGWGIVEIVDSEWKGGNKSKIQIRKSFSYDGDLRPNPDLSNTANTITAVYTMPVLVQ